MTNAVYIDSHLKFPLIATTDITGTARVFRANSMHQSVSPEIDQICVIWSHVTFSAITNRLLTPTIINMKMKDEDLPARLPVFTILYLLSYSSRPCKKKANEQPRKP